MSAPVQTEQHGLTEHSHGGWGQVPVQTRSERFTSVEHDAFPEVTGLEAEWKLTPVDKVRALIDGELDGAPYAILYPEAAGTDVQWIDRTDALIGTAGAPEERAAANAWSSFEKALHIRLTGDAEDLTVTRTGLGDTPRAAHTVISADKAATGLVVLDNRGAAQLSENVEIVLDDDANITVVSVQDWDDPSLHLASQFARIGRGATLKHIVVSLGGSVVRVNPSAHLAGDGAEAELLGVYFADAGQHLEQRVYVHHEAPHTRSRVTYKGALNGEGARTVWVGDVLIGRNAAGTDTYEQNRNLVLSARAPAPTPSRTSRSRPATSRVPVTPAPPDASTTSSCSTCRPAASPRTRRAASSSSASSARSCRRSASPCSRSGCTPLWRPNWREPR